MDIEELKAAIRDCGYEVHELEMENAKRYTLAEAAQALGLKVRRSDAGRQR